MGIFGPAGYMTVNLVEKKINGGVLEIPNHTESYTLAAGQTGGTGRDTYRRMLRQLGQDLRNI